MNCRAAVHPRTLPRWSDLMSDSCSVPKWLRFLVPLETPQQQAACRAHDRAYYLGGSRRTRAIADATFLLELLWTDMDPETANRYYSAVRIFGSPSYRQPGVSWSWGDELFAYSPAPAREVIPPEA